MSKAEEKPAVEDNEEEEKLEEGGKSMLLHLISQLKVGMDLSRVTLPTFILEPRSLLEKLTDFLTHPQLLLNAMDSDNAAERMMGVVRWYLSGWHVRPKGCKKPFNPIIGEIFKCNYEVEGSNVTYFAEQVSHHPPVSAFHIESKEKQLTMTGQYYPRSKFLGNSAASIGEGFCRIQYGSRGETYVCTWPSVYVRGIIFGTLLMELGGKVNITCEQTGYMAEIDFKCKPTFGGDYNLVEGFIKKTTDKKPEYKLSGKWTNSIDVTNQATKETKVLFNKSFPQYPKIVTPLEEQDVHESRKVWAKVTEALLNKDFDTATTEKTHVEEQQRAQRKEREKEQAEWEVKHFVEDASSTWNFVEGSLDKLGKPADE